MLRAILTPPPGASPAHSPHVPTLRQGRSHMTDEEAGEQADRASAALRDTILQLNDDGLDPQCIVEALIVQAVGLAFAEYGRAEGQYLVEGTMNACLGEAAMMGPHAEPTH